QPPRKRRAGRSAACRSHPPRRCRPGPPPTRPVRRSFDATVATGQAEGCPSELCRRRDRDGGRGPRPPPERTTVLGKGAHGAPLAPPRGLCLPGPVRVPGPFPPCERAPAERGKRHPPTTTGRIIGRRRVRS